MVDPAHSPLSIVLRGNNLSLSLGYVRGPAMTPRVADALTFTANWSLYL
jgi:hypothetical protein